MRIALITEGTYPHAQGGVSVWCDQLVRGLSDHRFTIHALVATGTEPLRWTLPDNVDDLVEIPLWELRPRRRVPVVEQRAYTDLVTKLLGALSPEEPSSRLVEVLAAYRDSSRRVDAASAMFTTETLEVVLDRLGRDADVDRPLAEGPPAPTIQDGVLVLERLEHLLRPLAHPAPRADVCHSAANGLGVLVALAAKWERATPFLLAEHGIYLRETMLANGPTTMSHRARRLLIGFVHRLTRAGYETADLITPGSDYNRRWVRIEGIAEQQIRCIHNGIDPDAFDDAVPEPAEPVLSWVGRIDPLKDPKTLLRAFARIHHEIPEARLQIYGTSVEGGAAYEKECRHLLEDLGLVGAAAFCGRVPDAADAYRAAQVVLLTSISEGFPFAVIEAMACGRPTVATDVGGVSEAVVDPALLAQPRDDEQLAKICIGLLADGPRRRALGAAGRRKVVDSFTLQICLDAHRRTYRELAGSSHGLAA